MSAQRIPGPDVGLRFLAGGNPPHNPGIYRGREIVTLWPVWVEPTQERVDNICRLIEAGREFSSREEIADELSEAGLYDAAIAKARGEG